MKKSNIISIQQYCTYHNIPESFINTLCEYELIAVISIDGAKHVEVKHIAVIERLQRLHYDLDINMEGLDVIVQLIQKIDKLQNKVTQLNNKLAFFEVSESHRPKE